MFGDRPRVTPEEWEHYVRPALSTQGFTDHQLDRLQGFFEQSFQTNPSLPDWKPGIDQPALDQTMKYLRSHPEESLFDSHQLDLIQAELEKYVQQATP